MPINGYRYSNGRFAPKSAWPIFDLVLKKREKALRQWQANINADLLGKKLPYPPPKEHCPHCGGELE